MRRHLICLERQQRNLQQSMELCQELSAMDIPVSELDCQALLERMETMEHSGTRFRDVTQKDIRRRYIAPVTVTALVVTVMAALIWLILWAISLAPEDAPPLWFVAVVLFVFTAIGFGSVLALLQRIQEIRKGEIDDAKKY